MLSFWKRIELTKKLLSVTCAQPAMHELGLKMAQEPIKFRVSVQNRNFLIESEQTFKLATMVRCVSLEKYYDPRFQLDVGMLNTLADAMLFGYDNQNLPILKKTKDGLRFMQKAACLDECDKAGFNEILSASIAGNHIMNALFMELGDAIPALRKQNNSKGTAINLCLEQFAKLCFGSKHAYNNALPNKMFATFMENLEQLLEAGAHPAYSGQTAPLLDYPGGDGEVTFFNACQFAALHHEKYQKMFVQIANIFALLIRYGAPIPDKRKVPFKNMDAISFELLNINIIIAYNQQNPGQSIISLHELSQHKMKNRHQPN